LALTQNTRENRGQGHERQRTVGHGRQRPRRAGALGGLNPAAKIPHRGSAPHNSTQRTSSYAPKCFSRVTAVAQRRRPRALARAGAVPCSRGSATRPGVTCSSSRTRPGRLYASREAPQTARGHTVPASVGAPARKAPPAGRGQRRGGLWASARPSFRRSEARAKKRTRRWPVPKVFLAPHPTFWCSMDVVWSPCRA
jgi:hypothetical protein